MSIVAYIDGERVVFDPEDLDEQGGYAILTIGREEYYLFEDNETAGQLARDYWEDMARNDPTEFRAMVGDDTLIAWALGEYAGPGTTQVSSLDEWLDLWLDTPEEHWASYDSDERVFQSRHPDAAQYKVAYRWN